MALLLFLFFAGVFASLVLSLLWGQLEPGMSPNAAIRGGGVRSGAGMGLVFSWICAYFYYKDYLYSLRESRKPPAPTLPKQVPMFKYPKHPK